MAAVGGPVRGVGVHPIGRPQPLLRPRSLGRLHVQVAGPGVLVAERDPPTVGRPRITSYNVCYTKLLRSLRRSRADRRPNVRAGRLRRGARTVITSYSIHYTKLYDLLRLLAWCSINQIYEPTFSRVYFESGYYHHNKNHIVELLNEIFEMFNAKKVHLKNEFYLQPARTYRNMIILNFGEAKATEIVTFSHLYMNSWGESFLNTYTNISDIVMIFSKVIKDGLYLDREFDEFCYFNSPEPHKKLYKQIEKVFRETFEYLKNGIV